MAKKSVKKVSFQMDASQALKARDFLAFALSKRTPDEYSTRKTAARKMVEQLNVALRIELGPEKKEAKKLPRRRPAKKAVRKVAPRKAPRGSGIIVKR